MPPAVWQGIGSMEERLLIDGANIRRISAQGFAKKPGGVTPMTVTGWPLRIKVEPTIDGSEPILLLPGTVAEHGLPAGRKADRRREEWFAQQGADSKGRKIIAEGNEHHAEGTWQLGRSRHGEPQGASSEECGQFAELGGRFAGKMDRKTIPWLILRTAFHTTLGALANPVEAGGVSTGSDFSMTVSV